MILHARNSQLLSDVDRHARTGFRRCGTSSPQLSSGPLARKKGNCVNTVLLILLFANLNCKIESNADNEAIQSDTTHKNNNSKYYTTSDIVLIPTGTKDTLKYTKYEFNRIVNNHHEFLTDYPEDPDQTYFCRPDKTEFVSEVGQDDYYVLYAFFLKQKNGIDNCAAMRKKLIDIYTNINDLFDALQYGGTYFGHQYSRILAYAEYSVNRYSESKGGFEKTYDITKQKELYIESLRQLIDDESTIDFNTLHEEDKIQRKKELNKIVDTLNKLITDNFYLRRAQEFQYEHYEYY